MNYSQLSRSLAKQYADQPVKSFPDRELTLSYRSIDSYSLQLANWMLSQGIKKGDPIAIWMGNVPEFVLFTAASLRIGTVLIPISIYEPLSVVLTICEECQCSHLFYDSGNKYISANLGGRIPNIANTRDLGAEHGKIRLGFAENAPQHNPDGYEIALDDTIVISFSSGSTGEQKGIQKSICSFFGKTGFSGLYKHLLGFLHHIYALRVYNLCPWYHNTGLTILLLSLFGGRFHEISCERYNPLHAIRVLKEYRPNIWLGTATMLYRCCSIEDAATLQIPDLIISSGEAISLHVIKKLETHSCGSYLFSSYGTTEVGGIAQIMFQFKHPSYVKRLIIRSVQLFGVIKRVYPIQAFSDMTDFSVLGNIVPSAEVILYDDESGINILPDGQIGEICIHKNAFMNGYVDGQHDRFFLQQNGKQFFRTGDLGFRKGDLLFLAGRKKNLIIRSGEKIIPGEIEQAALNCPGVLDAVACGIPSKFYGEDICLCLQIDPSAYQENTLQQKMSAQLPKHSLPNHILLWDEFPMNASGKTNIKAIREEAQKRLGI